MDNNNLNTVQGVRIDILDTYYGDFLENGNYKEPEEIEKVSKILERLNNEGYINKNTYLVLDDLIGTARIQFGDLSFKQGFLQGFEVAKSLEKLGGGGNVCKIS